MEIKKLKIQQSNNNSLSLGEGWGAAFVSVSNLSLKYQHKEVFSDLNWIIQKGEQWVLCGISGSGKTTLAKAITGLQNVIGEIQINFDLASKLPAQVLLVESWYQFKNVEGVANFYYQQRYMAQQSKETLTVNAELAHYGKENNLAFADVESILNALGFANFKDSQLIELSSGEHKKLQLVKALWLKPQLLVIDQPYVGLDAVSRKILNELIDQACADGVQLILISNEDELPHSINHFAEIQNGKLVAIKSKIHAAVISKIDLGNIPEFLKVAPIYQSQQIAKMVDVNINYGEKQVLKNINWEVKAGEKWLLQGPNGSGKSTLLSLINGDHPQSYANELYLFGNRRGSGESIWDIKQHIGLISPEFHWYFDTNSTVFQSIASGLYDSVGLFKTLPYSKVIQLDELISYFGLTEDKNELLDSLPLGKQRLVLLARTIIKNPELLILDEPCQGLDNQQTQHFNQLIDELCTNGMTLIYVGHYETQLPKTLQKRIVLESGEVKLIADFNKTEENKMRKHFELI